MTIKSSSESTAGRVAVTENLAPRGSGSPLHVHRNEDEWFYVLTGELTFWVGGQVTTATAGSFVYRPENVPHTFTVSSERARFLLVTEPAGFEGFVRTIGEPARELVIPPARDRAARHGRAERDRRSVRGRDPRASRDSRLIDGARRRQCNSGAGGPRRASPS